MKTFLELPEEQKQLAIEMQLNETIALCHQGVVFSDIEEATLEVMGKCEEMESPWRFGEFLRKEVGDWLWEYARNNASRAFYPEPGEIVIRLF
ncbi:hypothetical protein LP417_35620 (plasmid) [Polaromonas sp. P1-6]|nr:hypothetical protein LP417_35620 [Polaromonas sp. P1-6]